MLNVIAIFIGGGLGSISRYFTNILLKTYSVNFPVSTLLVNIIGSFILGFTAAWFWKHSEMHHTIKLAITVGFCGGLTTFSTFSWETFDLLKNGEMLLAIIYSVISIFACLLAISLGAFLSKYV